MAALQDFFSRNRDKVLILRDYIAGWTIALALWTIVRNVGVTVNAPASPEVLDNIRMILIFGPLAGVLFGLSQHKLEKYLYRRVPLWRLGLYGIVTDIVIISIIFSAAYGFFKNVVGFDQENVTFIDFVTNPNAILTFFYTIFVNFVMAALRQVNLLLGKGNLLRFVKGDFYYPRVENRIFMFVDLRGSTKIAEKLGHLAYSQFLQDCFYDLHVVQKYGAEVYQYVGDEVVLSWRVRRGMDYSKCLQAFWAFEQKLEQRSEYYQQKYGQVPVFKAGIHLGEVTTAEVGEIKREIAYHGDTMNVASRIQEKCNDYNKTLLVSEYFHSKLHLNGVCKAELMGEEMLRGKKDEVNIYAIIRTESSSN